MYCSFLIHSFTYGHLGCFQYLAIVNWSEKGNSTTYTIHKNKFKVNKKDLNISNDIIKVLQENIGRKISDIPRNNIFTNMSVRASDIKERINKWDLIKMKSFCTAKENSINMKREPTIWENIFANDTSDKGLISKICKELT